MSDAPTRAERAEFRERATDGRDHEWGWYVDDVPRILDALDTYEDALREVTLNWYWIADTDDNERCALPPEIIAGCRALLDGTT
jgi:hypothetical protein